MSDLKDMTLVAALKKLKTIEKRMDKNASLIESYASQPSNERPILGTEQDQKKEVASLKQANVDLAKEYSKIYRALTYTNLMVRITIVGMEGCISDFLIMKRKIGTQLKKTYNAMNENTYKRSVQSTRGQLPGSEPIHCIRFYDEKTKQEELRKLEDLLAEIDSRLENVNATTTLLEPPELN